MTSSSQTNAFAAEFSQKVLELRRKIHDSEYVDYAVQRVAQVLSLKIVEDNDQRIRRGKYESKR